MNSEEYQVMYQVEDSHWWYNGLETITRKCIEQHCPRGGPLRILDAGCGTGAVMGYLADYGAVFGFDYSADALFFCQKRKRERLTRASATSLPYPDAMFDLVASFDVVCVLPDGEDMRALREFARVTAPGGSVILRLPATPWLHGQHDEAVDIQRRYTARQVDAELRAVGLAPVLISYANSFLFPLAVVKRFSERFLPPQEGSDLTLGMGPFNGLFRFVLASEAPLVARQRLPFGLTVVAVARKPSAQVES